MANKTIPRDSIIKCPWCSKETSALNWNEITFKQCVNREMRKAYVDVFNIKIFLKNSNNFYKCPKCGMWARGNQLSIVHTTDIELLKLGGESPIQEVDQEYDD